MKVRKMLLIVDTEKGRLNMKIKKIVFGGLLLSSFALNSFAGECPKNVGGKWLIGYIMGYIKITEGTTIGCIFEGDEQAECLVGYYEALENKSQTVRCVGVEKFHKKGE